MNIAFVGLPGVPYLKRASDVRLMAFAQAYVKKGHSVSVINRYPVKLKSEKENEAVVDKSIKIIEVFDINRPTNKLQMLIIRILSYPVEFFKIIAHNKKDKIHIIQIYSGHFFEFIFYFIISRIIKAKIIYQYVEYRTGINRSGIYHKINGYLSDRFGYYYFDGIICISNFLMKQVKLHSECLPTIKVPPICDFEYFDSIVPSNHKDEYILFCGSTDYYELIASIIASYNLSNCVAENIKLLLVINGSTEGLSKVSNLIANNNNIQQESNLPYISLINMYKNATALLIPLRDTLQDKARFPNKICEYTASRNIIITTNFGEIPYYFEDKINALIASDNTIEGLTKEINWIISNKEKLDEIRQRAYNVGKINFNMHSYTEDLNSFLLKVAKTGP